MSNDFVNLPLQKLLNRYNFMSRIDRLESKANAQPSARVTQLGQVSQNTGNLVVDGEIVLANRDTGDNDMSISADGVWVKNQLAAFGFEDTNGDRFNIYLASDGDDNLILSNEVGGKGIILDTDTATHEVLQLQFTESSVANVPLLFIQNTGAETGASVLLGEGVYLWAGKDGQTTVFNEDSFDVDFRIEGATVSDVFKVNAGEDRAEFGADNYIPTRNSSNPNVYFNEAHQNMDFIVRAQTADDLINADASAKTVTFFNGYGIPWEGHGLSATVAAGATMYAPFNGLAGGGLNATNFNAQVKRAGKMKKLSMRLITAQPATGSLVVTLMVNNVASALVLTIPAGSAGATNYSETSTSVDVAVDDLIIPRIVNNASGASGQIGIVTIEQACFIL